MRRLAVVLAGVALLAASCGGKSSKPAGTTVRPTTTATSTSTPTTTANGPTGKRLTRAAYQAKLTKIARDIGAQLRSSTANGRTPTKEDLTVARKTVNEFASQLARIDPPPEVARAHAQLVNALRRLATDIDGIFEKVSSAKDASAAIDALFAAPAVQLLVEAQQELRAKGYDLDLGG